MQLQSPLPCYIVTKIKITTVNKITTTPITLIIQYKYIKHNDDDDNNDNNNSNGDDNILNPLFRECRMNGSKLGRLGLSR